MDIGYSIRFLRESKCVNQMKFANNVGISQGYLSQVERGHKNPSVELLQNIAEKLGIPLPVMFWFAVDECDINENKKSAFRTLKPSIDSLIRSLI